MDYSGRKKAERAQGERDRTQRRQCIGSVMYGGVMVAPVSFCSNLKVNLKQKCLKTKFYSVHIIYL